jgi:hypothetical protein
MGKRCHLESSNPIYSPLDHSLPLFKAKPDDKRDDSTVYKERIGSLSHAIYTPPAYLPRRIQACAIQSRFYATHLNAARRVLKYVTSTKKFTIKYGGKDEYRIDGYAGVDWGSDLTQWKPTTGYVFMMNGGPISWTSRKQTTVVLSTALSDAVREALAHLTFFQPLSIQLQPPILFTDNEAAEAIAKRGESDHQRSKHIDIQGEADLLDMDEDDGNNPQVITIKAGLSITAKSRSPRDLSRHGQLGASHHYCCVKPKSLARSGKTNGMVSSDPMENRWEMLHCLHLGHANT